MEGWKVVITITVQPFTKLIELKKLLQLLLLLTVGKIFFLNNVLPRQFFLRIIRDTQIIFISVFTLSSVQILVSG